MARWLHLEETNLKRMMFPSPDQTKKIQVYQAVLQVKNQNLKKSKKKREKTAAVAV